MRRLATLLLSMAALAAAGQTTVYFDLKDFNANPASNRWTTLRAFNPVPGNFVNYTSSASGTFYASNLLQGDYEVVVNQKGAAYRIPFQITVYSNDLVALINATNITSVSGIQTHPPSGRTAWTIQASDSRYAPISVAGVSSNFVTSQDTIVSNGVFAALPVKVITAGTNIVVITNGAERVIHGTATGSGSGDWTTLSNKPAPILLVATNDGSSLTNLNISFTNIAQMTASALTPGVVFVQGYTTPGDYGGGAFWYDATSSATTNTGTVFAHTSGTGRWLRVLEGDDIYVEHFGASSASSDNANSINAALRWWIYETGTARKGKIRFRTQSYGISNAPVLICKTNGSGTGFDQVYGLVLEADAPTPNRHISAEIVQNNPDLPAVIVQHGDSIEIKNLNLRGKNRFLSEGLLPDVNARLQNSNYISQAGSIRTNAYSPHAGIVSDPFANYSTLSNANQYPGLSDYYRGTSGGTARIRLQAVQFADFFVGAMMNPNPCPTMQQGDGWLFDQCGFSGCTYLGAIGQSESKAVTFRDCGASYCRVGFTTKYFGQAAGCAPAVIGGQYGFMKHWFDVALGRGRLSVQNVHAESLLSMGWIGSEWDGDNFPASFIGCDIRFATQAAQRSDFAGVLGPVTFESCSIGGPGFTMNFVNDQTQDSARNSVAFNNCRFVTTGVAARSVFAFSTERNVAFNNSYVYDQSVGFNAAQLKGHVLTRELDDYNRNFLPFGATISCGTTNYQTAFDLEDVEAGLSGFVFNGDGTGYCTASDSDLASNIRSNDVMAAGASWGSWEPDGNGVNVSVTGRYIGRAGVVSSNWIQLVDVPIFWTTQNVTSATVRRLRRFHQPTTGSTTAGAYTITNVSVPSAWAVGDQIRGSGLRNGTVITNIAGNDFGISRAATATASGVALHDAYYFHVNRTNWNAAEIVQPFNGLTTTGGLAVAGSATFTNGMVITNSGVHLGGQSNMTHLPGYGLYITNSEKYATLVDGVLNVSGGVNTPAGSGLVLQMQQNTKLILDASDVRPASDNSYDLGRSNVRFQDGYFVNVHGNGGGLSNILHTALASTNTGSPGDAYRWPGYWGATAGGEVTNVDWGEIQGTLADQTDLNNALNARQYGSAVLSNVVSGASNAYAGSFTGDGAGLTNVDSLLNPVVTGTLTGGDINISGSVTANGFTSTAIFSGNGSGLTNIAASAITSPPWLTNQESRALVFNGGVTVTNGFVATNVLTAGLTNYGSFLSLGGATLGSTSTATNLSVWGSGSRWFLLPHDSSTPRGWMQQQADGTFQVSFDGRNLTNLNNGGGSGLLSSSASGVTGDVDEQFEFEAIFGGLNFLTAPELSNSDKLRGLLSDESGADGQALFASLTAVAAGDVIAWDGSDNWTNGPPPSAIGIAAGTNGIQVLTNGQLRTVSDLGVKGFLSVSTMNVTDLYPTNVYTLAGTNKIAKLDANGKLAAATTTNGTAGQFLAGNGSGVFYWADGGGVPTTRTLTVTGTANQLTSSAGEQDLSADRTWTLSLDADIAMLGTNNGANLTGLNDDSVVFDDADNLWTATAIGPALEELNDSINAGVPNGSGAKVHWSQLLGVPAGFADNTDDGAGSSVTNLVYTGASTLVLTDGTGTTALSIVNGGGNTNATWNWRDGLSTAIGWDETGTPALTMSSKNGLTYIQITDATIGMVGDIYGDGAWYTNVVTSGHTNYGESRVEGNSTVTGTQNIGTLNATNSYFERTFQTNTTLAGPVTNLAASSFWNSAGTHYLTNNANGFGFDGAAPANKELYVNGDFQAATLAGTLPISDVQAGGNSVILTNNHSVAVTFASTITGNGSGITNIPIASIVAPAAILTNGATIDTANVVFKKKEYLCLKGFDTAVGALPVNSNDWTQVTYMLPEFLNGTDKASNYIEWRLCVPEDLDTSVALRARVKFRLTAADTGSHRYVMSFASVADSASFAGTVGTEINLDFAGDGSGASGDVETTGWATLTGWAAGMTAGQLWVIRLARDGDTSDTSTVNSQFNCIMLEYSSTQ